VALVVMNPPCLCFEGLSYLAVFSARKFLHWKRLGKRLIRSPLDNHPSQVWIMQFQVPGANQMTGAFSKKGNPKEKSWKSKSKKGLLRGPAVSFP